MIKWFEVLFDNMFFLKRVFLLKTATRENRYSLQKSMEPCFLKVTSFILLINNGVDEFSWLALSSRLLEVEVHYQKKAALRCSCM
jgi:hypothetical protein